MDLNNDNQRKDVGVLAPNNQENEDANVNVGVTGTPIAKKTRRAVLRRMNATSESETLTSPDPPKTPGTLGNPRQTAETPRRSCRKSVRPPIDYDDIIVRSAKKVFAEAPEDKPEDEEGSTQKWSVAEVGKNSRKRSRKSKRVATKKQKTEKEDPLDEVHENPKSQQKIPEGEVEQRPIEENIAEMQAEENVKMEKTPTIKASKTDDKPQKPVTHEKAASKFMSMVAEADIDELGLCPLDNDDHEEGDLKTQAEETIKTASQDVSENEEVQTKLVAEADIDELGLCPLDNDSHQGSDLKTHAEKTIKTASQDVSENEEVETKLRLRSLDKSKSQYSENNEPIKTFAQIQEKEISVIDKENEIGADDDAFPEEEMPPLLMDIEDHEEPNKSQLNTTFDADDKLNADESLILIVNPDKQPEASTSDLDASVILVVSPDKKPDICAPNPEIIKEKSTIKVVLTTADDQNQTLLNLADLASPRASKPKKNKGFRFPTPYKGKPMLKFTETSEELRNLGIKKEDPKYERKRSKSASDWNDTMSRTVCFQSPIEIVHVDDIDERWKGLQKSNVNSRPRRSKSLDENRCNVSRIPKPSRGILPLNRTITPSKLNKRTKMPNFAAMHEKQFAQMESLLDHVERKAERAKVLTNSVKKQLPGSAAKKPQSVTSASVHTHPKALKKIDMTSDRTIVVPAEKLNSSRLPLKITAPAHNVVAKPAFNLSTTTVKSFNATFTGRPLESQDNKLAERRQRRIEMFKGRTTKDQKEKGQFIRGVRLNRRFELQMQHRRHLEED
ncbi:uncharacterized protein LOC108095772 [Drosophila ficusphila]|uniref:uncharacterized protein LOC108095772 n=1 Tax=Drosophila ficusphila TaxID=30025 RepID=UPI0007E67412|nr:uncharacterized protein LOC108095772 [Drosophila ficusphila]